MPWSLVLVLLLLVPGCSRIMGPKPPEPIPPYGDGVAGLMWFGTDVLHAAQANECERVHELFASLKMSRAELDDLFGPRAADLAPAYNDMMDSLVHLGAVDLCALVYDKKYDTVEVTPVDLEHAAEAPQRPDSPIYADAALARSLVRPTKLYTLRISKAGAAQATRYNFFVFHDGKWRTGNQLGRLIDKRELELTRSKMAR